MDGDGGSVKWTFDLYISYGHYITYAKNFNLQFAEIQLKQEFFWLKNKLKNKQTTSNENSMYPGNYEPIYTSHICNRSISRISFLRKLSCFFCELNT